MGLQILKQRQIEGTGSNATLQDQMSNLSKAWVQEVVVATTGAGQSFTLNQPYTNDGKTLKVYYNGQLQKYGVSYTETNNRTIAFPDVIYEGDDIVFRLEGAGSGVAYVSDHGHVFREVMTGVQDGSNRVYRTHFLPMQGAESVFLNGVLQNPTIGDYTIVYNSPSGKATITLAKAPASSDALLVNYIYSIAD